MANDIRHLARRQAEQDARPLPKASTKREPSNIEANTEYTTPGYYLHFCFHKRSYYEVCTACRRTKREAMRNLSSL